MLQNCWFQEMIQVKEPNMGLPNVSFSTYFFFLGKGEWGLGDVANNDSRESQITGKIFKTRFSWTLISLSLWSHFWKWGKLSHSLGWIEFLFFIRDLDFWMFDIFKDLSGIFFFFHHHLVCSQHNYWLPSYCYRWAYQSLGVLFPTWIIQLRVNLVTFL